MVAIDYTDLSGISSSTSSRLLWAVFTPIWLLFWWGTTYSVSYAIAKAGNAMLRISQSRGYGIAAGVLNFFGVATLFYAFLFNIYATDQFADTLSAEFDSDRECYNYWVFVLLMIYTPIQILSCVWLVLSIKNSSRGWWIGFIITYVLALIAGGIAAGFAIAAAQDTWGIILIFAAVVFLFVAQVIATLKGKEFKALTKSAQAKAGGRGRRQH